MRAHRPASLRGALRAHVRRLRRVLPVPAGILRGARAHPRAARRSLRRRNGDPAHLGAGVRAPRRPDPGSSRVLAGCALLAAAVAAGLLAVTDVPALFAISFLHGAALAPITTLADALALRASVPRTGDAGFEYGWVRGTGSGAFILGTLLSGQVVGAW